jgi:hypothetical protein
MFALFTASLLFAWSAAAGGQPILAESFDAGEDGSVFRALAAHPLLEVVDGEGVGGSRGLKATYEGYDRGSKRIVLRLPISQPGEEMTLSYDVRFADNFQFVGGGKLHGLGPARPVSGGNEMTDEGWSARINFGRNNTIRTYMYVQDKPGRYGQALGNPDFRFALDRYYAISLHVKLNKTADASDGFARIYVDGELKVDQQNLRFRAAETDETLISELLISTFHGGSSPQWAPKDPEGEYATVHAYFDNFAVYAGEQIRQEPGACWKPAAAGE